MTRHDYRVQGWGHSAFVWPSEQTIREDGVRRFCVFGRISEGDEIVLRTEAGDDIVWRVEKINSHPMDPGDQYFVTMRPIDYLDDEP